VLCYRKGESIVTRAEDIAACNLICSYRPEVALQGLESHFVRVFASKSDAETLCFDVNSEVTRLDQEYRVIVRHPKGVCTLPPSSRNWSIQYEYACPPLPQGEFNSTTHTVYVWGDVDFDDYGQFGRVQGRKSAANLHSCKMNQIVPQVMIGNCLAGNDDDYSPRWKRLDSWMIQAQYYWQTEEGERHGSRALCGDLVHVNPGEILRTVIQYCSAKGHIEVIISVKAEPNKRSKIVIERPFCHNPALFSSWRDFFNQCEVVEKQERKDETAGALARPCLNIEYKANLCDLTLLRSITPFDIRYANFPSDSEENKDNTTDWRCELFTPRLGNCNLIDSRGVQSKEALRCEEAVLLQETPPRYFCSKGKRKLQKAS